MSNDSNSNPGPAPPENQRTKRRWAVCEFTQPRERRPANCILGDAAEKIVSGVAAGNIIHLELTGPSTAQKITYLKDRTWNHKDLPYSANGIAVLTFCTVPISISQSAQ